MMNAAAYNIYYWAYCRQHLAQRWLDSQNIYRNFITFKVNKILSGRVEIN